MADTLTFTGQVIYSLEALAGLVAVWFFVLRKSARARWREPSPLPHWDIPGYTFAFAALWVIGAALVFQLLAVQLSDWLLPALDKQDRLLLDGSVVHPGILFGLGMTWYLLKSARFAAAVKADPAAKPPAPLAWRWVPLAGAGTFFAMLVIALLFMNLWSFALKQFGVDAPAQEMVKILSKRDSAATMSFLFVTAVFLAPISEEWIFRGIFFRYLRNRLPRPLTLLLPAVLFGALHLNLAAFPALVAMGVVHALVYERTGRITVPIISHALFNLNTTLILFLATKPVPAS